MELKEILLSDRDLRMAGTRSKEVHGVNDTKEKEMTKKDGIICWPGNENAAVKTYGLLKDAGYFASAYLCPTQGFTVTWAIPPKGYYLHDRPMEYYLGKSYKC